MSAILIILASELLFACFSSSIPPACNISGYLGKHSSKNILVPPGGGVFNLPIGLFPYITWDKSNTACAQPTGASISVRVTCNPSGGGQPIDLGTQSFSLNTPVNTGAQDTSINFNVPAGTPSSICNISATYSVVFGGGIGAGTYNFTGDLQICLVEPSPNDDTLPRLDMEFITTDSQNPGVYTTFPGDLDYIYFKITNNDLEHSAVVDLFAEGRQIAGLADDFLDETTAYNNFNSAISNTDGDFYPIEFFTDDPVTNFLPGDPLSTIAITTTHTILLGPGDMAAYGLAYNSYPACGNGSCGEQIITAKVKLFNSANDTSSLDLCLQAVTPVDNTLTPRSPGITFEDMLKTDDRVDIQRSNLFFNDAVNQLINETHFHNLLPGQGGPFDLRTQTTGGVFSELFQSPEMRFPATVVDQITFRDQPSSLHFNSQVTFVEFNQISGLGDINNVLITGLENLQQPLEFPTFFFDNGQPFTPTNININVPIPPTGFDPNQTPLEVTIGSDPQIIAPLIELNNVPGLRIDPNTCRRISLPHGNLLDEWTIHLDPPLAAVNFVSDDVVTQIVNVINQAGEPVDYTASIIDGGDGLTLSQTTGNGNLELNFDPSVFSDPFETRDYMVKIENPAALNNIVFFPIPARKKQVVDLNTALTAPSLISAGEQYRAVVSLTAPQDFILLDAFCFFGVDKNNITFSLPFNSPFDIKDIDSSETILIGKVKAAFGASFVDSCLDKGKWGLIEFGDGFTFETEIFTDGFESGDISSWSSSYSAQNANPVKKQQNIGVLNENNELPVISAEDLRKAIELFNDDTVFDEKTIGLVSERFGILEPLPPARGTYFFDEFESFRKSSEKSSAAKVVIDGINCPVPCSGLILEGDNSRINGIRFENFSEYGVVLKSDSNLIVNSEFANNGKGGLHIVNSNNNSIGSTADSNNRFSGNQGPGVFVESGTGNSILFNTFVNNSGLAIDLGNVGVTTNDAADSDTGANFLQNFPIITNVQIEPAGGTLIQGTLNSAANRTFNLQFFLNTNCDPSGNGEGEKYIGSTLVTTNNSGDGIFSFASDSSSALSQYISATATDSLSGNTSEFSLCFKIESQVSVDDLVALPDEYLLYSNYPNPFNPTTTIRYALPKQSETKLVIFNVFGQPVRTLVNTKQQAGFYSIKWNGLDDFGNQVASGLYLYRIKSEGFSQSKKMMLMK